MPGEGEPRPPVLRRLFDQFATERREGQLVSGRRVGRLEAGEREIRALGSGLDQLFPCGDSAGGVTLMKADVTEVQVRGRVLRVQFDGGGKMSRRIGVVEPLQCFASELVLE